MKKLILTLSILTTVFSNAYALGVYACVSTDNNLSTFELIVADDEEVTGDDREVHALEEQASIPQFAMVMNEENFYILQDHEFSLTFDDTLENGEFKDLKNNITAVCTVDSDVVIQ